MFCQPLFGIPKRKDHTTAGVFADCHEVCRLLNMSLYTIVLIIGDYWKHSSLNAEDMLSRTQCYGIINGAPSTIYTMKALTESALLITSSTTTKQR